MFNHLGGSNQENLENGACSTMTPEHFGRDLKLLKTKMQENIENCLSATGADVIVASEETTLTTIAMAAGYPIAAIPLGLATFNGRPFGLEVMARSG